MSKVLKVFIILSFVLSIAGLTLGTILFSKRELLTARAEGLAAGYPKIASALRYEELNPAALYNPDSMGQQIQLMAVAGNNLFSELQDTKTDLENTKLQLAETREELDLTLARIPPLEDRIASLEQTVNQQAAEARELRGDIDVLNEEKQVLIAEVESLEDDLATRDDSIQDLTSEIKTLESVINELEASQSKRQVKLDPDLMGKVLLVNEPWNFVILDIGRATGLLPNAELVVHRRDELVGRVRISELYDDMAIAEIVPGWSQDSILAGDYVMYVVF